MKQKKVSFRKLKWLRHWSLSIRKQQQAWGGSSYWMLLTKHAMDNYQKPYEEEDASYMDRYEYLEWCKERALEHGNCFFSVLSSMLYSIGGRLGTEHNIALMQSGIAAFVNNELNTPYKIRYFIDGFGR